MNSFLLFYFRQIKDASAAADLMRRKISAEQNKQKCFIYYPEYHLVRVWYVYKHSK